MTAFVVPVLEDQHLPGKASYLISTYGEQQAISLAVFVPFLLINDMFSVSGKQYRHPSLQYKTSELPPRLHFAVTSYIPN